ncbi:MAG: 23S rRNA (guanosine(2251)-2'-O)-methyltransferase RlmB [Firmicutes bacterium]|nr:23S rRNA (guanosine(2251)-2'-O)-methyltransferase RlmB [Bacillota bacterium]
MLVFGKNVALEYLNSDKKIYKAFIQNNFNDYDLLNKIKHKNIKVQTLTKFDMDKKVNGLHQGIILDVEDYKYADIYDIISDTDSLIVMLDHIEDPHNFGAIIRSCEAAGVDGIIIPTDRSVEVNSTVIKTSVGTTEKMKIARVTNLNSTIKLLKEKGYWIFGTDMDGTDYTKLDYKGKTCIICGNEGSGMSKLVRENCDFIASIPMQGEVNSLNASVATAIIVFEAVKQRI